VCVRKVQFILEHAMQTHRGSRGMAVLFFYKIGCRWGRWSTPRQAALSPGRGTRYPLYRRLGGIQDRSGRVRKISPLPRFDSQTVEPIRCHYIDNTVLAHAFYVFFFDCTNIPSGPGPTQ
jgi:hypothetical protein